MLASFGVHDEPCQPKVDHMHDVRSVSEAHHDVVWLDVSVDVILPMQKFYPLQKLIEQHESRLQGKLFVAEVEQILKTRTKEVSHKVYEFVLH